MANLDSRLVKPTALDDVDTSPHGRRPLMHSTAGLIWGKEGDKPDREEAVEDKGSFASVADAVANAPGTGNKDVVEIGGMIHRWDGATYLLEDDKAPVQTDAGKDTFTLTEAQYSANIIVPYRDAGGALQFFLPRKTFTTYNDYVIAADFESRHEAEGSSVDLNLFPPRSDTLPDPTTSRLHLLVGHAILPDAEYWSDGTQWIEN